MRILWLLAISAVNGYNILFVNTWHSKSHALTMMYLAENLADHGHNITIYSQVMKPIGGLGNKIRAVESVMPAASSNNDGKEVGAIFWFSEMDPLLLTIPHKISYSYLETLKNEENFIEILSTKYDLVILDEMFMVSQSAIGLRLKQDFGSKLAIFSTTDLFPYASNFRAMSRTPSTSPTAYAKTYAMFGFDSADFYGRLMRGIDALFEYFAFTFVIPPILKSAGQLLGVDNSFDIVYHEIDLTYVDYPVRFGNPQPQSTDTLYVSEHCEDHKKLPDEILSFVNDPSSKGTIYVAFGSIVDWTAGPKEVNEIFLRALNRLKDYRVIWSYAGPELSHVENHVMVTKWAPQNDILHHPKTILFFTHGGIKSFKEAVCSNTPMLILPFFADQAKNAAYLVMSGLAQAVYKRNITEEELYTKITSSIDNKSQKEATRKFHKHFTDLVHCPLDAASRLTERAIRIPSDKLRRFRIFGQRLYWIDYSYGLLTLPILGFVAMFSF